MLEKTTKNGTRCGFDMLKRGLDTIRETGHNGDTPPTRDTAPDTGAHSTKAAMSAIERTVGAVGEVPFAFGSDTHAPSAAVQATAATMSETVPCASRGRNVPSTTDTESAVIDIEPDDDISDEKLDAIIAQLDADQDSSGASMEPEQLLRMRLAPNVVKALIRSAVRAKSAETNAYMARYRRLHYAFLHDEGKRIERERKLTVDNQDGRTLRMSARAAKRARSKESAKSVFRDICSDGREAPRTAHVGIKITILWMLMHDVLLAPNNTSVKDANAIEGDQALMACVSPTALRPLVPWLTKMLPKQEGIKQTPGGLRRWFALDECKVFRDRLQWVWNKAVELANGSESSGVTEGDVAVQHHAVKRRSTDHAPTSGDFKMAKASYPHPTDDNDDDAHQKGAATTAIGPEVTVPADAHIVETNAKCASLSVCLTDAQGDVCPDSPTVAMFTVPRGIEETQQCASGHQDNRVCSTDDKDAPTDLSPCVARESAFDNEHIVEPVAHVPELPQDTVQDLRIEPAVESGGNSGARVEQPQEEEEAPSAYRCLVGGNILDVPYWQSVRTQEQRIRALAEHREKCHRCCKPLSIEECILRSASSPPPRPPWAAQPVPYSIGPPPPEQWAPFPTVPPPPPTVACVPRRPEPPAHRETASASVCAPTYSTSDDTETQTSSESETIAPTMTQSKRKRDPRDDKVQKRRKRREKERASTPPRPLLKTGAATATTATAATRQTHKDSARHASSNGQTAGSMDHTFGNLQGLSLYVTQEVEYLRQSRTRLEAWPKDRGALAGLRSHVAACWTKVATWANRFSAYHGSSDRRQPSARNRTATGDDADDDDDVAHAEKLNGAISVMVAELGVCNKIIHHLS